MNSMNYATITLVTLIAIIAFSLILSWRKRAVLKPNLADLRHETEAEILKEHEKEKEEN